MTLLRKVDMADRNYKFEGLVKGDKKIIQCSACRKELLYIWITRPDEKIESVFAKIWCPWCGDYSYKLKVVGGFHIGHTESCSFTDIETDDEEIKVQVEKGGVKSDDE